MLSIDNAADDKEETLLKEELSSIVTVISGDDWIDYRPARPEDFVGRKNYSYRYNKIFRYG